MMINNICFFDLLPVELVHSLFNYFWADEIIHSFSNINDHIDDILLTYDSYKINFQSILKYDFDIICDKIRTNQITTLILSDDDDTPDQSKIFFRYFNFEEFIRLRSFTLIDIESNSLELILSRINKLKELRSLSIKYNRRDIRGCVNYLGNTRYDLSLIISQLISQLDRLNLGIGFSFGESSSPTNLRYLTIKKFDINNLQMLFCQMPQLIYLNICLEGNISNIKHIYIFSPLRYLKLRIIHSPITMDEIEYFLSNLSYLKRVELDIKGQNDLTDGYRWELLSKYYIIFNFKFNVELDNVESIIDSFRSSFWLLEKHWYVVYENKCLFTVPHFTVKNVIVPYYPSTYSTIANDRILYNNINSITIYEPRRATLNRFHYLKELNIRCLPSLDNIGSFMLHIKMMPRLHKISLNGYLTEDFIENIQKYQSKQIRILEIDTLTENLSYIIEGLIILFPRIERLRISTIKLKTDLIRLIDGFTYLSNGSFIIQSSFIKNDQNWFLKPELSIRGVRRLKNGSFTCRYYRLSSSNLSTEIHLWIGKQSKESLWKSFILPQRGYIWYRSMYLLSYYSGINNIRNKYFDSYLYKFLKESFKIDVNYFIEGLFKCLTITCILFIYLNILMLIITFYFKPSIIIGLSIFINIYVNFPSVQYFRYKIISYGYKICMNIFKMMITFFSNRRFY